ncbi:MAG: hypothetical protein ACTSPA_07290 [Promethearchaeota archaeon]
MTTILLRNILREFEDLPDEIKEKHNESLQNIKSLISNLINSIKASDIVSKSISTSNPESNSNVFNSPTPNVSLESQLDEIKSEMLDSLKKNKNVISIDHKEMIE